MCADTLRVGHNPYGDLRLGHYDSYDGYSFTCLEAAKVWHDSGLHKVTGQGSRERLPLESLVVDIAVLDTGITVLVVGISTAGL